MEARLMTQDQKEQRMRAALHALSLDPKCSHDERRAFGHASYYVGTYALSKLVEALDQK
jgi:hypothetical protein